MTVKELESCTVDFYKDEDDWLMPSKSTNKISICEPLKNIVCTEHRRSNYKCHVMSIIFESFSLLLSFKAQTTMSSWIKKLNNIRRMSLVCVIYCIIHNQFEATLCTFFSVTLNQVRSPMLQLCNGIPIFIKLHNLQLH